MIDKIIIANKSALLANYGDAGWRQLSVAMGNMIGRDAASGLTTEIIYIDDPESMAAIGGIPVTSAGDEAGAKAAVDAAYAAHTPDYIVLLGGPDIVPHIQMDIPQGVDDDDGTIPSDLPYACDAPFSRDVSDFVAVTRIVGRIPAPEGSSDTNFLVTLLDSAGGTAGPGGNYTDPFAISVEVWRKSTELNVQTLFGSAPTVSLSPPDGHPGIESSLGKLIHLINCHGAQASDEFYGEEAGSFPVAMSSRLVGPHVQPGAVIGAECCYGAELYDFGAAGTNQPICTEYLQRGANAFVGSTNIAYGPAEGNSQADLMVQFFLRQIQMGASTGRAMLEARQKFVTAETMSNPISLKTLGQFLLLGDPSLHPVSGGSGGGGGGGSGAVPHADGMAAASATAIQPAAARKLRRIALRGAGVARSLALTLPRERVEPSEKLAAQLAGIAEAEGLAKARTSVFRVGGGAVYEAVAKLAGTDRKVATMVVRDKMERNIPFVQVVVVHISGDTVGRIERLVSR